MSRNTQATKDKLESLNGPWELFMATRLCHSISKILFFFIPLGRSSLFASRTILSSLGPGSFVVLPTFPYEYISIIFPSTRLSFHFAKHNSRALETFPIRVGNTNSSITWKIQLCLSKLQSSNGINREITNLQTFLVLLSRNTGRNDCFPGGWSFSLLADWKSKIRVSSLERMDCLMENKRIITTGEKWKMISGREALQK